MRDLAESFTKDLTWIVYDKLWFAFRFIFVLALIFLYMIVVVTSITIGVNAFSVIIDAMIILVTLGMQVHIEVQRRDRTSID